MPRAGTAGRATRHSRRCHGRRVRHGPLRCRRRSARLGRARRGRGESLAERDRGPGARGRELDDAKAVSRGDVVVEPSAQAFVELLGSLDVGHGDDVDLEMYVDLADARVTARVVDFGGAHVDLRRFGVGVRVVLWSARRARGVPGRCPGHRSLGRVTQWPSLLARWPRLSAKWPLSGLPAVLGSVARRPLAESVAVVFGVRSH